MKDIYSPNVVADQVDCVVQVSENLPDSEHQRELEFCAKMMFDTSSCLRLLADTPTHLPADKMAASDVHLDLDTKTSPTNIGLYLASLVAMRDMGIMAADQAASTIETVLSTLDNLDKREGLYYNWYDTVSGEILAPSNDQIISPVENAWLAVGLMTIKNAGFGQTSDHAGTLFNAIDISRLYDPKTGLFYGHFNATQGAFSAYHNDILLSETRIASYLGMSNNSLPLDHFQALGRHAPAGQQVPPDSEHDYIKSWGGSMFEALMPTLFVDEEFSGDLRDAQYDQVRAQIEYGNRHLAGHWGVSVCLTPNDGYQEIGVHANAMSSCYRESRVITPHAKLLALPYARELVLSGLIRDLSAYPDCYRDQLGFSDSIDTSNGDVSDTFLALDQAMIFLALFNDWQKDTGGIRRYTSPELTSWRLRINPENDSAAA